MTHLTNSDVDAYWRRALAPAELVSLDRHIAACEPCREALWASAPPANFIIETDPGDHLEYEQVEEYVNESGSAEARAAVETHLAECGPCRAEAEDLRRFRSEYRRRRESSKRKLGEGWWHPHFRSLLVLGVAAAICAVAVLVWYGSGMPRPGATGGTAPGFAVLLRDGGQAVGLDPQGKLRGLADLPQAERAVLAALLAGGDLPLAGSRAELAANGGPTRSAGQPSAGFAVTDPLGRVTLEDRPVFRWTALPGASSYRVEVLDLEYRLVAESILLAVTEWQPEKPLARGRVYAWQVTAIRGGAEARTPQPPASEARFAVLDQARAERIMAAMARRPVSHLALAALDAEAGIEQECLRELEILDRENPGSALVGRLRAQLPASQAIH